MTVRVGTTISFSDPALAELVAAAFDFVWIDLEHGALSTRDVQTLAIVAQSAGAEAFVRIPSPDYQQLGAVLDARVDGVVVPMVETPGGIAAFVQRLRYPPRGVRGLAPRRAAAYGRERPALDRQPELIIQIETPAGVRNADAIAEVDGVDALVVGTADLGITLNSPDELNGSITAVRAAATAADKPWGIAVGAEAPANGAGDAQLILLGSDVTLITRGIDHAVAWLRQSKGATR